MSCHIWTSEIQITRVPFLNKEKEAELGLAGFTYGPGGERSLSSDI